jgi:hypothetical protein
MNKSENILMEIIAKINLILLILVSTIFFYSCSTDKLILNRYNLDQYQINAHLLNGIDKAVKINDNSLKINEDAIISLKIDDVTQYNLEFDLSLLKGNEIIMFLNTTHYDFREKPDLEIILSDKGYKISQGSTILAESDTIKFLPNENHRIKFTLDAAKMYFTIDCTDLQINIPHQISTEYVFFKTNSQTATLIRGIQLTNLRE